MTYRPPAVEYIAKCCHDAARAISSANDQSTPPEWAHLDAQSRERIIAGVRARLTDPYVEPADNHQAWCDAMEQDGWVWGIEKDEALKTHPALVPFEALEPADRRKNYLFIMMVAIMGAADFEADLGDDL